MPLLNMTVEIRQESIGWKKSNGIGKGPWAGNQTTYRHAAHFALSELQICVVGTTVQLSTCDFLWLTLMSLQTCNTLVHLQNTN